MRIFSDTESKRAFSFIGAFKLTIFVLLSGCGQSQQTQPVTPATVRATALEGTWQLECQADESPLKLSQNSSYIDNYLIFKNNKYTLIQRSFEAPAKQDEKPCSPNRQLYMLVETGHFDLKKNESNRLFHDEKSWKNGDWGSVENSGRTIRVIPVTGKVVDEFNAFERCEITNWSMQKYKVISNKKCFGSASSFSSRRTKEAVKLQLAGDGGAAITFGAFSEELAEPMFDEKQRFVRLTNLPFSFKNPNEMDTQFVKGH